MTNTAVATIMRQAGLAPLEDKKGWTHRFEVKSETSTRVYVVSKRVSDGVWGCGCMGWKRHRNCKHLAAVAHVRSKIDQIDGLGVGVAKPTTPTMQEINAVAVTRTARRPKSAEAMAKHRERVRHSFSDAAYKHFDPAEGFGNADEWARLAEGLFEHLKTNEGDHTIHRASTGSKSRFAAALAVLGLSEEPETLADLKAVARTKFLATHPDHGGTSEKFRAVHEAYEKLAKGLFGMKA